MVDTLNKIPIPFVLLQSEDLQFNQTSDENGFIDLKDLPESLVTLFITRIGYSFKTH